MNTEIPWLFGRLSNDGFLDLPSVELSCTVWFTDTLHHSFDLKFKGELLNKGYEI